MLCLQSQQYTTQQEVSEDSSMLDWNLKSPQLCCQWESSQDMPTYIWEEGGEELNLQMCVYIQMLNTQLFYIYIYAHTYMSFVIEYIITDNFQENNLMN